MANFDAINDSLCAIDWPSALTQDLNSAYSKFTSIFLQVINSQVPSKTVCDQPLPPWLPRPLLHKIKRRRVLFCRAVTSESPLLLSDYLSLQNSISAEVKQSTSKFFNSISHSPQRFWSYVRSLRRNKDSVPPLTSTSGSLISDNAGKASLLNQAFSSFFTVDPIPPVIAPLDPSEVCSEDILCTPASVNRLISSLPIRTSPCPDCISSLLLKSTGSFPSQWKQSSVIPIPKTSPPFFSCLGLPPHLSPQPHI